MGCTLTKETAYGMIWLYNDALDRKNQHEADAAIEGFAKIQNGELICLCCGASLQKHCRSMRDDKQIRERVAQFIEKDQETALLEAKRKGGLSNWWFVVPIASCCARVIDKVSFPRVFLRK